MERAWRPLTIGEKGLVLAAVLGVFGVGILRWRQRMPSTISFSSKHSIRSIAFSPDSGKLLVTGEIGDFESSVPAISDTFAQIYEVGSHSTFSNLTPAEPKMNFGQPSWSPDGKRIATGYQVGSQSNGLGIAACWGPGTLNAMPTEGRIAIWDTSSGQLVQEASYDPQTRQGIAAVEFSTGGQMLWGTGQPPALFSSSTGDLLRNFDTSSQPTTSGSFSQDGTLAAISSGEGENIFLAVHDVSSSRVFLRQSTFQSSTPQWSANKVLAFKNRAVRPDREAITIWDGVSGQFLPSPPVRSIYSFALNPQEPQIIFTEQGQFKPIGKSNYNISSWNWRTQKTEWTHNFDAELTHLTTAPNGLYTAMLAHSEKREEIWVLDSSGVLWNAFPITGLGKLSWSPDSHYLASTTQNNGEGAVTIIPIS